MALKSFVGWRGLGLGVVCLVLGVWAVTYTCNTETAACKGVVPWPGTAGFMNATGWVVATAGIVLIIVVGIAWVLRAARGRTTSLNRPAPTGPLGSGHEPERRDQEEGP